MFNHCKSGFWQRISQRWAIFVGVNTIEPCYTWQHHLPNVFECLFWHGRSTMLSRSRGRNSFSSSSLKRPPASFVLICLAPLNNWWPLLKKTVSRRRQWRVSKDAMTASEEERTEFVSFSHDSSSVWCQLDPTLYFLTVSCIASATITTRLWLSEKQKIGQALKVLGIARRTPRQEIKDDQLFCLGGIVTTDTKVCHEW